MVLMSWLWIRWVKAGRDLEAFSSAVAPVLVLVLAVVASPWLAAGLIVTVTSLHSLLIEHGQVDWPGTGAMLTALVAVPGAIAAVYFGIMQYRRAEANASLDGRSALKKVDDMLPDADESGMEEIGPRETDVSDDSGGPTK